ncbi:SRPBCC domain-containing protein [bacterium]|nr:SRPBCC domain-containing protein [bacterium]
MESFELKIAVETVPQGIFAALTDPKYVVKWDTASWVLNDMCPGGRLRKRDEEGFLSEGEIVMFSRPARYAYLWPVPVDMEDPDEETFLARFEFVIEGHGLKSLLIFTGTGFPTVELAEREKNTWGGYFLEKIKKVAESIPAADLEEIAAMDTKQGHVRKTERATQL